VRDGTAEDAEGNTDEAHEADFHGFTDRSFF
jgi:hypothetical protein